ncbi:glycosyltransferase family 4 protein [Pedobacter sp. SD-b]|uniref:Glycosyltransferase family 4 protein n=1 Tax=Pedobacter segetis TaxID=2793069 RepID=A0ABS1BMF7_9SPHI|nr:glycosyltransferase family 4 protein [Pedobacter segetis]MBK0384080.1 glycosyltransferase family 4 protein [Pedobacter segetis]
MRILMLTNRVPFPADGGYAIVVRNTIEALLGQGCEVHLFSLNTTKHYIDTRDIEDPIFQKIKFLQFKVDNRVKIKDAFFNLFSKQSYNISRFYNPACASRLVHLLKNHPFDIIQFEGLQVTPYLQVVKENSEAKLIYRAHNIEYQIWKRLTQQESFIARKIYLGILSKRLKRFEFNILNGFDTIVAISFVDQHFFESLNHDVPVQTLAVALNLENYKNDYKLSPNKSVGYIGSMDWRPNIEGLDWFLDKVWPNILQLGSGITFHLAGKNIPKQFQIMGDESFIMEGKVDNAIEFISRQHVLIVPLLSGSGMRVKIIEAMALGKCIIATSIAAEGINYHHDRDILIADKSDDFYRQILRCFTDKNLINRIGQGAKKLVEKNHDQNKMGKELLKIYEDLQVKPA